MTCTFLIADGDLARDRAAELDARAAVGDEEADQLAVRDERDGEPRAPAAARELGPELGEAERLPRACPAPGARPRSSSSRRRVEEVDVARPRGEQRMRVGDDGLEELVERVGARDRLGELGQLLELGDAEASLLVQARVLDRARRRGTRR